MAAIKRKKLKVPVEELDVLANYFLPKIQAFYESEEGQKELEAMRKEKEKTSE